MRLREGESRNHIPEADYADLGIHIREVAQVYRGLTAAPRRWSQDP